MSLLLITERFFSVKIDLKYATDDNFTGAAIYSKALCYLHPDALECLKTAIHLAKELGYTIKIWDAFRPTEAQEQLWAHTPDINEKK